MPRTQTRVVGSGFTSLEFDGKTAAFMDGFDDSGQQPLGGGAGGGPGWEPIHPLASRYVKEIVTSRALGPGTLTLRIRELWNEPVWVTIGRWIDANRAYVDILDVWEALEARNTDVTCTMLIRVPGSPTWRGKTFHGCKVTAIDVGEAVQIGTLSVARNVSIAYAYTKPISVGATS